MLRSPRASIRSFTKEKSHVQQTRLHSYRFGGHRLAGPSPFRFAAGPGAERPGLSSAGLHFPVRRQRFEQYRRAHGRRQLQRLYLDSRSTRLTRRRTDRTYHHFGRSHSFPRQASGCCQPVFQQRTGRGGQRGLSGSASDSRPVPAGANAHPFQSFLAFRSAARVAELDRTRWKSYRLGRARRRLHRDAGL
jgi:hypothetical protein